MKFSLVVVAIGLFVAGAGAIKCYVCENCSKPTNSVECPVLSDTCGLSVAEDGKKTRICYTKDACDIALVPKCDGDTQDNCIACCDTDNCNSAGIASFNIFTVFAVLLISLFFTKQ